MIVATALVGCGEGETGPAKDAVEKPPVPVDAATKDSTIQETWLGYVSRAYVGDLASCTDAVKVAMKRLNLQITDDRGGIFSTDFEAEARDGTSLTLQVKEIAKDRVRVSVKVGYFLGDGDAARRILSEIEDELRRRRSDGATRGGLWNAAPSAGGSSTTLPAGR